MARVTWQLQLLLVLQALNSCLADPAVVPPARRFTRDVTEASEEPNPPKQKPGNNPGRCRHGDEVQEAPDKQTCKCYDGWRKSGITDIFNFMDGVCDQYTCESDEKCQLALGIPTATCPLKTWNCYCGWRFALRNWGHGWETAPGLEGGAACMGIMYTFSIWATETTEMLMMQVWKAFVVMAVVLLPFGRKRAICDHHWPSMWNGLRSLCGFSASCHGECVMSSTYTLDTLKDDLAWSLYILDVGVWLYMFLGLTWAFALVVWSIMLWLLVAVVLLCSALIGGVVFCGECLGSCCQTELQNCGSCACPAECHCGDCGCCCPTGAAVPSTADPFFWSGTFPYDPFFGYSGYGAYGSRDSTHPSSSTGCCKPFAWMFWVFPAPPENAWGGLVGYLCFGTHHMTPPSRIYQGNSAFVEFMRMGWRRRGDLHGDDDWRTQVYNFLAGNTEPFGDMMRTRAESAAFAEANASQGGSLDAAGRQIIPVGRAYAVCIDRPFDASDRCVPSSFEDYLDDRCWICCEKGSEWDLWLSCRHLFCKRCSMEMLKRRMPCPLCRVSSSTVLRGQPHPTLEAITTLQRPSAQKERTKGDDVSPQSPGPSGIRAGNLPTLLDTLYQRPAEPVYASLLTAPEQQEVRAA